MIETQIGGQTVRYDRDATAAIYASMGGGWAERCGCVGCRNFLAQQQVIYPEPFKALLHQLGVDPAKESEAVLDGPLKSGLYHYGGWFFFVGEFVATDAQAFDIPDSPCNFTYYFTRTGPCPKEFRGGPRASVLFETRLQWLLPEPWDSDHRPSARTPQTESRIE